MTFRSLLFRARYLALVLPAFALFSTAQVGCTGGSSTSDDFSREDNKGNPNAGGYGGYGNYDDDNGYDTYGYD